MVVKAANANFDCDYVSKHQQVALCECKTSSEIETERLSLSYLWGGKSQHGESIFVRVNSADF